MIERLVSDRVPYVPIDIQVRGRTERFEALLDTGFEGDVPLPEDFAADLGSPDEYRSFTLADGSRLLLNVYVATADLDGLGSFPVKAAALGDECLIGLRLANRFFITLDHGRQIIVEP